MAVDVASGFEEFIRRLQAKRTETSAAASHRTSIQDKLRIEFGLTAFFRTGSFGNGTNVSGYSDVDYFAVIPVGNLKADSSVTLASVAQAMRDRFATTPNIRVNGPAVQIPFGLDGAEHTEIIPVDATGMTRLGFRQFDMPDGNGGWKFSAPESHKAFVEYHDQRLGGRLKPLIQCVKAWKFYRDVPIRSFYLEMFVTYCMLNETTIVYPIDLRTVFYKLYLSSLGALADPRFNDMTLAACTTEGNRLDALAKCETAWRWSHQAIEAKEAGQNADAFNRWDLVFNYNFPNYTPFTGFGSLLGGY